ncbi:tRNA1(Val) (adenine(37)-N6)-methyltransferase [Chryseobacterium taklimakanense]|uniref:tRNA1(Val) (adenine(37)-N6)-methyltransferase n=1 Tax=Chryseobacterium taklimakanense TaxID=536441 RepID=A0A3G8WER3_9FLAO|nr:methyltransferase [Chryseobacterium taklimakanense]AZI19615.1 methyltransferase domain-containing protein [Chryseobacterium taklimakanense]
MKPFTFQQFTVNQSEDVFRVGTDGVLLGALANISDKKRILEVGTGSGLISLMLAQRNPDCQITAIDINEKAVLLAKENFENSPFSDRLSVMQSDFKNFHDEAYDLIVSNPPYFDENSSAKDAVARQKIELDFNDLIRKSSQLISDKGTFCVIIPFESGPEFISESHQQQFQLIRKVNIAGIIGSKPKRLILEFSKTKKVLIEEHLTIEKSPRQYSEQYIELTKDFHVFGK